MLRVSEDETRRREGYVEGYRQLGRSLLDLQRAADRVFDAISQRTAEECEKLTQISERIQKAKASIEGLSDSKKPLIIKQPLRYPTNHSIEQDFCPLFQHEDDVSDEGFPMKKVLVNGGLNREFGADGTLELFQFFSEANSGCSSKVADNNSDLKQDTFLENLLQSPQFTESSDLKMDSTVSDFMLDDEKEELPPPSPSLLLNNIPHLEQ